MAKNNIDKLFKRESKAFAESLLRNGANHIGGQLLNAVSNVNQPTDIVFGNIAAALRNGVIATGQEVVRERLSRI
jgi:hypothetical protein